MIRAVTVMVMTVIIAIPVQAQKPLSPGGVDWCGNSWGRSDLEGRILTQTDSPIRLGLTENKRFVVATNVADADVYRLRLGAVRSRAQEIVHLGDWIEVDLNPSQSMLDFGDNLDAVLAKQSRSVKVAVVDVEFADGRTWRATSLVGSL